MSVVWQRALKFLEKNWVIALSELPSPTLLKVLNVLTFFSKASILGEKQGSVGLSEPSLFAYPLWRLQPQNWYQCCGLPLLVCSSFAAALLAKKKKRKKKPKAKRELCSRACAARHLTDFKNESWEHTAMQRREVSIMKLSVKLCGQERWYSFSLWCCLIFARLNACLAYVSRVCFCCWACRLRTCSCVVLSLPTFSCAGSLADESSVLWS